MYVSLNCNRFKSLRNAIPINLREPIESKPTLYLNTARMDNFSVQSEVLDWSNSLVIWERLLTKLNGSFYIPSWNFSCIHKRNDDLILIYRQAWGRYDKCTFSSAETLPSQLISCVSRIYLFLHFGQGLIQRD